MEKRQMTISASSWPTNHSLQGYLTRNLNMKCNKNDSVANSYKYVHCLSLQLHKHAAAILRHDVLWGIRKHYGDYVIYELDSFS